MELRPPLFCSSRHPAVRAMQWGLTFGGPLGFPAALVGIGWALLKGPVEPALSFHLFIPVIVLMHLALGPVWSASVALAGSIAGFVGFSLAQESRLAWMSGIGLQWATVWVLMSTDGRLRSLINSYQEEADKAHRESSALDYERRRVKEDIAQSLDQKDSFNRLQFLTDDLVGAYNRDELLLRGKSGLESMYSRTRSSFRVFPEPEHPAAGDVLGEKLIQSDGHARLFTSRVDLTPSLSAGKFILAPLKSRDQLIGWMGLEKFKEARPFAIHDLRLASLAADLISLAVGNADRYAQVESLALTDSLTGLFTRGYFDERLHEEFARARHTNEPLSLILLDADHFKKVNDDYGHAAGDEALRWLARLVSSQARETDFVARFGGEEIAVLMPSTRREDASQVALRLHRHLQGASFHWENQAVKLTVSIGISSIKQDVKDERDLIRRADQALYRSKEEGRNRVSVDD